MVNDAKEKEPSSAAPSPQEAVQALIGKMRERERDLFYSTYPRLPDRGANEHSRAGALAEVQRWRGELESALHVQPEGRRAEEQEKES